MTKISRFSLSLTAALMIMYLGTFQANAFRLQIASSSTGRLRIRSEPSLSGKVHGYLNKGDYVWIVSESKDLDVIDGQKALWYQILSTSAVKGWASGVAEGIVWAADQGAKGEGGKGEIMNYE